MFAYRVGSLVLLLGALFGAGAVLGQEPRPGEPQEMLLGLIVDGREALVVDGYWDGSEFFVPVDAFLEICRCRAESVASRQLRISTPLGTAVLPTSALIDRNGVRMVRERALDSALAVRLVYDPTRFALVVDLPWRDPASPLGAGPAMEPDVRAPNASLSSSLFRLQHIRENDSGTSSASVTLNGRGAGGQWRMRYDDDFGGAMARLAGYGWVRRFDDKLLLLGHQQVSLHPLLGSVEMTGMQAAWTNQPLDLFVSSPEPSELLPRQLRSTATIRGMGVAAGTAILRIEDRVVAAQVMGLDGRYEFRNVAVPTTGSQRIEVLIFDRHDQTAPLDIQDHSRSAGRNLLPGGAIVVQGGVGQLGNLTDPSRTREGAAGFYQTRVGVSDRVTMEGAYQLSGARNRLLLGVTSQIGRDIVSSVAAAVQDGHRAFMADVAGTFGAWRVNMRSRFRDAGYDLVGQTGSDARESHFFEISRRNSTGTLELGAIAQASRGFGRDHRSVLPWAYWRPDARLFVRARPDSDGRYRFDASWIPDTPWRIGVSRSGEQTVADLSWRLSTGLRASLVGERTDAGAHREGALVTWTGRGRYLPSVSAGPLLANGRPGALVSLQMSPTPGILVGARYENSSMLHRIDQARDQRISLIVTGNLAFAGTRILPGSYSGLNSTTGSVGGRLRVAEGYDLPSGALEGIVITVDGRPAARTTRDGRFQVVRLPPGVHLIDFDPAGLPLELTPQQHGLAVEVVPGAVTRADMWLDVEFGLAGRVTAAGENARGIEVELMDASGERVARDVTDRFGFYRLDAVPRGTYHVRLADPVFRGLPTAPQRVVRLIDDYLFDQDLALDILPPGVKVAEPAPAQEVVTRVTELPREPGTMLGLGAIREPEPVLTEPPAAEEPVVATVSGESGSNMTGRLKSGPREIDTVFEKSFPPELVAPDSLHAAPNLTPPNGSSESRRPDPRLVRLLQQMAAMRPGA